MRKTVLALVLIFFTILAVSCIETNYPTESSGKMLVRNDSASGKTITRIVVTSVPSLLWGTDTYLTVNVSILPGGSSQEYSLEIEYSQYFSDWNRFRVIVTLDDNSTAFLDVRLYEDIVRILRCNGTNLVQE